MKTITRTLLATFALFFAFSNTSLLAQHHKRSSHERHHDQRKFHHNQRNNHRYQKAYARQSARHGRPSRRHVNTVRYAQSNWCRSHHYNFRQHVYFRDYCTFYDPQRRGYVYWSNNRWLFSPVVPAFLTNVNLATARIQLMANIPLDRHPEYYYDEYARAYPRNSSIDIQVSFPL